MEHKEHKSCMNCGSIKCIASFLCAACLWAHVGTTELNFGEIAGQGKAANDFSTHGVDFIFNTSTGVTATVSTGDLMIDFAHIYQIAPPKIDFIQKPDKS